MRHHPRLRSLGRRLLFPRPAAVLACVLAAALGLGWVFRAGGQDSPLAYGVYTLSAYALAVLCAGAVRWGRALAARVGRLPPVARYRQDPAFRVRAGLGAALALNLGYAALHALAGWRGRSAWSATLAVYYLFLAAMRVALMDAARRAAPGARPGAERRRARLCGVLLVAMNLALAGVVVLVLHRGGGFAYAGNLIYAMALYAFYATILGVVNLVRTRRSRSPLLAAARAVSLASALVSMLALEVAMLDRFGSPGDTLFRNGMIAGSGLAVCAVVAGLGLAMALGRR